MGGYSEQCECGKWFTNRGAIGDHRKTCKGLKLYDFTFNVGIFEGRKITVRSHSHEDADYKARIGLDEIYEKEEREPPVSWTLVLIKLEPVK